MAQWIVDGNNVFGSRPDGWWNDRAAAARRLVEEVARWQPTDGRPVTVVFDGPGAVTTSDVEVIVTRHRGRDAADREIEELVADRYGEDPDLVVVTSDRGLIDRLPPGVRVVGARQFLAHLASGPD
ncbi:MAG: NYN domain-containing protein [Acidimicrobiia bacterium]|nr:NYN domain-containing protein [Acidimicrobiia bacterium]